MSVLTVGVVGAGRIGKLHVDNLKLFPEIRVKTVSDIRMDHLKEWAQERQIEVLTTDNDEIFNDPEIQAVFICTSTNTHTELIKKAAASGKHIFCEKPISYSIESTMEAIEAVEKTGVKLFVGFNRRFDPNFRKIHQLVKEGKIGKPNILRITSRDPEPPSIEYVKTSGGLFIDMTIHDFDMARYIMGCDVVEVTAHGAVLVDPKIGEAGDIDTAVITLRFENGALGVIDNSRRAVYGYDQRLEVFGDKGMAKADNKLPTEVEVATTDQVMKDKPLYFFLERYNQAFINEVNEFVAACLENKEVSCTGRDALQAELIAKAAKQSLETGVPVKLSEVL